MALLVCLVVVFVRWGFGPWYEGMPLSYWLDHLKPVVWTDHNVRLEFHSWAAAKAWQEQTAKMQERSAGVLKHAGPECLPMLISRLTARDVPRRMDFFRRRALTLQRWAYISGLTDHASEAGSDGSQVRRGQAVRAIMLLGDRAASLVPQLSTLAARGTNDDPVTVAARIALSRIAPDEFRGIGSPRFSPYLGVAAPRPEPSGGATRSQPIRAETNQASPVAGSGR